LHVAGYEVQKGPGHHVYTINSLEFSLGKVQKDNMIYLSKCSKLRHQSLYNSVGVVSHADALELLETARAMRELVLSWLRAKHQKLLPKGY
jgi:hypothetical protein